ncbi:flagellar biosynthesis protein FlhB [Paraconexibacter algicola]|uniref:Flagellar biosynthetic protein FlhB n=1 Tax=Paraconexibacter algicola TaxID=2133960 RepID=A0A2T4UIR7_9ACTN|nr:flagellar biosynthesis protein FlhB [Paraconexibacter algicola]PTL59144.1 flagellar biosynthesis protein FlhB [Paraconexibacter algicola]
MGGGSDKTEKATPKKRAEAREKGQVARSPDLSGAIVMLVGVVVLGWAGPAYVDRMGTTMQSTLANLAAFEEVNREGVGRLLMDALVTSVLCVAPVAVACAIAGAAIGVIQVGPQPMPKALMPDPKRLNPVNGFKNIFGPNAIAEAVKSCSKVGIVGAIVFAAVGPKLTQLGAMVGVEPAQLAAALTGEVRAIALRAASAYLLIGLADFGYQKWRNEKQLRMDKQEVKEEAKGQSLPAEVRSAQRRRAMQAARGRMMEDVPTADVVITNPTHYAVALKYEHGEAAPIVVAKGKDILAARIRELATENGVPLVPNPPLARGLHASVEVGQQIPEEFYAAVAQVLAFVYRVARRRRAVTG